MNQDPLASLSRHISGVKHWFDNDVIPFLDQERAMEAALWRKRITEIEQEIRRHEYGCQQADRGLKNLGGGGVEIAAGNVEQVLKKVGSILSSGEPFLPLNQPIEA